MKKVFDKEWSKCEIPGRRKQWKICILEVISDMDLPLLHWILKKFYYI